MDRAAFIALTGGGWTNDVITADDATKVDNGISDLTRI